MKKMIILILTPVIIFSLSLHAGLTKLVVGAGCAAGAVACGIQAAEEYKKASNFSVTRTAGSGATTIERTAKDLITGRDEERQVRETAEDLKAWGNRWGKTVGFGTASGVLALTALRLMLRK